MTRSAAVYVAFAALALAVYGASLGNAFVLDDIELIVNNQLLHSLGNVTTWFLGSTMNAGGADTMAGMYYRPVTTLWFGLLWAAAGETTWPYHLAQVLLHAGNAFLLYLVFSAAVFGAVMSKGMALFLALVFLVHPLNTEVVVYVADAQDALFMALGLLAVLAVARSALAGWRLAAAVGVAILASLLAKESGALLLGVAVLYAWLYRRPALWPTVIGGGAAVAVYLALRIGLTGLTQVHHSVVKVGAATIWERLMTTPAVLAHYVGLFLFPRELTITEDWLVTEPSVTAFWIPLLVVGALAGLVAWQCWRTRERAWLFFALWTAAGLGLHAQIVPLDGTVADRWAYFTVAGFLGLAGLALAPLAGGEAARRPALALAAVVVVVLGLRSFDRSLDWRDGMTLYAHDLALQPDSQYLHNNLGYELFRVGKIREAGGHFQRATELAPHWDVPWSNLGAALEALGDLAGAEEAYRQSVTRGAYYLGYENYAKILLKRGKTDELRGFLADAALVRFPLNPTLLALASHVGLRPAASP